MNGLVLSLFPGIGLLDMAFEEEGFCVVRGPDLLWGGDIRKFNPPVGRFDGVIGGPPCQAFSQFRFLNPCAGEKHGNMIPEFERIVTATGPRWFLMENVKAAPVPRVEGYKVAVCLLNTRWLGEEQDRLRRFSFGTPAGQRLAIETVALESPLYAQAVACDPRVVPVALNASGKPKRTLKPPTIHAGHSAPFKRQTRSIAEMCELQGLPSGFLDEAPFTAHGKRKVIGNGVPLPMGRAVAKAVKEALNGAAPQER